MFLLDTNVVSELRKGKSGKAHANVVSWAESIPDESWWLSTITLLELETGVLRIERKDPAQGAVFRKWFDEQVLLAFRGRILTVDVAVARLCARLHVPDPGPDRDFMIAATAIAHNLVVVTRNVKDFQPTGVDLLNPWL